MTRSTGTRDRRIERAALVSLVTKSSRQTDPDTLLDELAGLARAAGADVVLRCVQERDKPDAATLIGSGKAEALGVACAEADVSLVIVDNELTPAQARNLEERVGRRVIDRTELILDIFALRARTRGKTAVRSRSRSSSSPGHSRAATRAPPVDFRTSSTAS